MIGTIREEGGGAERFSSKAGVKGRVSNFPREGGRTKWKGLPSRPGLVRGRLSSSLRGGQAFERKSSEEGGPKVCTDWDDWGRQMRFPTRGKGHDAEGIIVKSRHCPSSGT